MQVVQLVVFRPVINRVIERSMINYSGSNTDSSENDGPGLYIEPLPFWGTLKFGDALCSYESGYLRSEEIGGEVTTYEEPLALSDIGLSYAPQSFAYI